MESNLSYTEALSKLEEIVEQIEDDDDVQAVFTNLKQ